MAGDLSEILERAKSGEITAEAVARVARELEAEGSEADPYTLLHVLGRAGAVSYRGTIERFLWSPDDPMLARISLQVLCRYWGDTGMYLDQVHEFVRGVPWDDANDVRLVAISVGGEFLRGNREPRLLQQLARILDNADEPRIVREAAYVALARAVGEPWERLPAATRRFDLDDERDPTIIRRVNERLGEEVDSEKE